MFSLTDLEPIYLQGGNMQHDVSHVAFYCAVLMEILVKSAPLLCVNAFTAELNEK